MTMLAIPEENAHRVLEVFSYFESVPGKVLPARNFVAVGERRRWNISDLQKGLEFASAQGWVRKQERGIELTEQGFANMRSSVVTG